MEYIRLDDELWFPDPKEADRDGFLAYGGDLSIPRLLLAYHSGIFPWYSAGEPIQWWSPNPRMVLFPEKFKVSKSLRKSVRAGGFKVTFNTCFERVIFDCAIMRRSGQSSTWIIPEMQKAYIALHEAGYAKSVEVWRDNELVGGLYGIDLPDKKLFCGESMFSFVTDASKVALYHLVQYVKEAGYRAIDCQVYTNHLASLGAEEIDREVFLSWLRD